MEAGTDAGKQAAGGGDDWKQIVFEIGGFFKPREGAQITGRIVAYRHNKRFGRNYFLIELAKPCEALSAENREEMVQLEPGQVLWVNESAALKDLVFYVNQESLVRIKVLGKKDIQGGQKVWRMKVEVPRGVRKGQPAIAIDHTNVDKLPEPKGGANPDPNDDDIPF